MTTVQHLSEKSRVPAVDQRTTLVDTQTATPTVSVYPVTTMNVVIEALKMVQEQHLFDCPQTVGMVGEVLNLLSEPCLPFPDEGCLK